MMNHNIINLIIYKIDQIHFSIHQEKTEPIFEELQVKTIFKTYSYNYSYSYHYHRIRHFIDFINQFENKLSPNNSIKEDLDDVVIVYKNKYKDQITHSHIRECLKELHYNKYYEYAPYIFCKLNNKPIPQLTRKNKLILMFRDVQKPYWKITPHNKGFLSYPYISYKFCELLGLDEFLDFFPLITNRAKLHQVDKIWESICKKLNWEFIKSV